ncbi:MAG: peptidoglycan-associated lipoprotein Pal [Acidobacteriota bacterium]|nr:peptidoglycan-associated lipoprotein Pal [Acidobacteriota bacterium]
MKRARLISIHALSFALVFALTSACKAKAPKNADASRPAPLATTEVTSPSAAPTDVGSPDGGLIADHFRGPLGDAFYDYDAASLREDARAALARDAEWLKSHPTAKVLIEGHCDERGTDEYNMSLGDRRANAAKEYLSALGIEESRCKTVSYGRQRPYCTDDNEECYRQNRRAHFLLTAK